MNRFLLINNKDFFDKNNIVSVTRNKDIPDKNSILFIGIHNRSIENLSHIKEYFTFIKKYRKNFKYIIIIGKGDNMINQNIAIPNNVKFIYANNVNYNHPKIHFLPMGSDFRSIKSFPMANINNKNRPILCYCNFSLNTHPSRRKVFNLIKNKKSILCENMGSFLKYSISRDDFFKRIGNSKFVICPRGNALDTFRLYDTIYGGAIPIVVKEKFHNTYFFENVPILYLNKIENFQLLNRKFLEKQYILLSPRLKNYYHQLNFQTWMNKINNIMNNIK
jgi:hypothetical protein